MKKGDNKGERNGQEGNKGTGSHFKKLNPFPFFLSKSNSQPQRNQKSSFYPEDESQGKYATIGGNFNSKITSDDLRSNFIESRTSISTSKPLFDPQGEQKFTNSLDPKTILSYNVNGLTSPLGRSVTLGSRSMSKVKSLNNMGEKARDYAEIYTRKGGDALTMKTKLKSPFKVQNEQELFTESPPQVTTQKLRTIKSGFLKTSSNTFSNIIPKIDKMQLFSKSASISEDPIMERSKSDSPNLSEEKHDNQLLARANSDQNYPEENDDFADEGPSMSYLNDDSSFDWINEALRQNSTVNNQTEYVYGALFSEIAFHFYLLLINQGQDSWPKLFSGSEAVDMLCKILNTPDRRMALLIGRALDSQGFLYHVNHELRLRDTTYETYSLGPLLEDLNLEDEEKKQELLPNGVFTLLTECYSPTCTPEFKCYSVSCPRRFGNEIPNTETQDQPNLSERKKEKLWENFVSAEILNSVSDKERKRQEVIFELIYTENDFVSDLKIIQEVYLMPIYCGDFIPEETKDSFIKEVFINILEIQKCSFELSAALTELQNNNPIVKGLGQVLLNHLYCFEPYKDYGSNQVYSKRRLAKETKINEKLDNFLKEQARLPECRKLPIQSFLGRPTTRLGRFPLLLEAILKYTSEEDNDYHIIPKVIQGIKDILSEINIRAGKADNRVRLDDLSEHLTGPQELIKELDLNKESRLLIREGTFKKKHGVENSDLFCFLLDNYFLMTKKRKSPKKEGMFEYKISKKPIKLDLLALGDPSDHSSKINANSNLPLMTIDQSKSAFPLIVNHLGRHGGTYTLLCSTQTDRDRWKAIITEQRNKIILQNMVFKPIILADKNNCPTSIILCSAVYESACTLLIGSEDGIYAKHVNETKFKQILILKTVTQIELIEESDLMLILSDRTFYYISLSNVFSQLNQSPKPVKLKTNIDFFSIGECLDRTLICAVKSTALSTTFKIYHPTDTPIKKGIQTPKNFFSFSTNLNNSITFFKEFYIPSESFNVYFLKSKICVACTRGFEVLDFNLNPQSLLDPSDPNLNFVISRGETVKPISFFRIRDGSFFVCFNEFGFFIDRAGKLDVTSKIIYWKGTPKSFALCYPFVLSFDPTFIEVWNIESFQLEQTILAPSIQALRMKPEAIHYLESSGSLDHWQLNGLVLNRSNPSFLKFRKNLREKRVTKRRGIIIGKENS